MSDCHNKKKCQQYLNGELELSIEPPITKKPECNEIGCPIFLELETQRYQEFLESPLCKEINTALNKRAKQEAEIVNKVLTKEFLTGK